MAMRMIRKDAKAAMVMIVILVVGEGGSRIGIIDSLSRLFMEIEIEYVSAEKRRMRRMRSMRRMSRTKRTTERRRRRRMRRRSRMRIMRRSM